MTLRPSTMNLKRLARMVCAGLALMMIVGWMPLVRSSTAQTDPALSVPGTLAIDAKPAPPGGGDPAPTQRKAGADGGDRRDGSGASTTADVGADPSARGATGPHSVGNGDFERGRDGTWQEYSTHGWPIVVDAATLYPVPPHGGSWAAWLGGDHDEVSYLSQMVTVPAATPTLTFWHWIASEDVCGYDFASIQVGGATLQSIPLCFDAGTGGWVLRTVDLSAYAGQTVELQLRAETDSSLNSNWWIDDVTFDDTFSILLPAVFKNVWSGYFDDFSDPNSGWASGTWEWVRFGYLGGEYQILIEDTDRGFLITPDLVLPADYKIEVDARQASGHVSAYGVMFGLRWDETGYEGYQFLIDPNPQEYLLDKRSIDGSWNALIGWTAAPGIIHPATDTNHLVVERVGSAIRLYINGTWVNTASDGAFTSAGRDAGLFVDSYDQVPVDVRFDNVAVSSP